MTSPNGMHQFSPAASVRSRDRGFTLIEVMVALFITAVGLLGIAKIQALAYASTGSASVRSLVAMEAAGLAASMHANRIYWAASSAPALITITGPTVSGGNLGTEGVAVSTGSVFCNDGSATSPCGLGYCQAGSGNTPCPVTVSGPGAPGEFMAASDLQFYATGLNNLLNKSSPTTTIVCSVGTATAPVNCEIQVTWNEKAVSISSQSAASTTACTAASPTAACTFNPTYTLYVEP